MYPRIAFLSTSALYPFSSSVFVYEVCELLSQDQEANLYLSTWLHSYYSFIPGLIYGADFPIKFELDFVVKMNFDNRWPND